MMNKLIGVSGFARSGKDTFCSRASNFLKFHGHECATYSFANALKGELDELLIKHTGISAFSEQNQDKEIIRPLLVTYGTEVRRKLNPDCWIESISDGVESDLLKGKYVFISDVRFLNEAEWIKNKGGYIFNIQRDGVPHANRDELLQYKLFNNLIDYKVSWPSFGDDQISLCDDYIIQLFSDPTLSTFFPKNQELIDIKGKYTLNPQLD